MTKDFESVLDTEDIKQYEADIGKEWREDIEERMVEICSFYDYGFTWDKNGRIVINNGFYCNWHADYYKFFGKDIEKNACEDDSLDGDLRHYEYESAEDMVNDWIPICRVTNQDYIANGNVKSFGWLSDYNFECSL